MKKIMFIVALVALPLLTIIGRDSDEKIIRADQLPAAAKTFIATHFPTAKVSHATKEWDEYEVYLNNGFKISFNRKGVWDDVDSSKREALPESIIALTPKALKEYVTASYPDAKICEINKERWGYEIELSNGLELDFNLQGEIRRIDD